MNDIIEQPKQKHQAPIIGKIFSYPYKMYESNLNDATLTLCYLKVQL